MNSIIAIVVLVAVGYVVWLYLVVFLKLNHQNAYRKIGEPSPFMRRVGLYIGYSKIKDILGDDKEKIGLLIRIMYLIDATTVLLGIYVVIKSMTG
jgi:hypothetical protein